MKITNYLKKSILIGAAALLGVCLLLSGLGLHRLHPLIPLSSHLLPALSQQDCTLSVAAHVMNGEESKRAFGHDLPDRGVSPLLVSVQNNTPDTYALSASSIDLPRVEASTIAWKISKSSVPRAIAYKVAGFIFWPLAIPGTIDSIRAIVHHSQIKQDINAKALRDETIAPYSTLHRVLFVSQEQLQLDFKMTLIELESLQPTEIQVHAEKAN